MSFLFGNVATSVTSAAILCSVAACKPELATNCAQKRLQVHNRPPLQDRHRPICKKLGPDRTITTILADQQIGPESLIMPIVRFETIMLVPEPA